MKNLNNVVRNVNIVKVRSLNDSKGKQGLELGTKTPIEESKKGLQCKKN